MKRICILTTGGTIAMREDPAAGGLVPAVSGADLAASAPGLADWAGIAVEEVSNIPSEWMTPARMMDIARRIDGRADAFDGFVVTHGTDTMEETAFLLDTVLRTEKPVVLTGAMRGASELSADGPANLLAAVKTAASDGAAGMGVLVVMGDAVHAARDVEKMHATRPDAFASPQWGPVGAVYGTGVVWGRRPLRRSRVHPEALAGPVWIVKCAAGEGGGLIRAAPARRSPASLWKASAAEMSRKTPPPPSAKRPPRALRQCSFPAPPRGASSGNTHMTEGRPPSKRRGSSSGAASPGRKRGSSSWPPSARASPGTPCAPFSGTEKFLTGRLTEPAFPGILSKYHSYRTEYTGRKAQAIHPSGEVSEWLKVHDWKSC